MDSLDKLPSSSVNIKEISGSAHSTLQKEIIGRIRDLIVFKNLEPGDKLPSERVLSERFEVTRNNLRDAIQRLEFYGILQSIPQSGTFIANIGRTAMQGMLNDILSLNTPDFKSLVETRILLELKTVELAALRRTNEDLEQIRATLNAYNKNILGQKDALEEDLLFHLAIARASKNDVMINFMLIITPEIITNFEKYSVCDELESTSRISEHENIYQAIENKDSERAKEMMRLHLNDLYQFCYQNER